MHVRPATQTDAVQARDRGMKAALLVFFFLGPLDDLLILAALVLAAKVTIRRTAHVQPVRTQ